MLLSEGHIAHGTVDIDRRARLIEKSGPTGLLMTTTEAAVDPELETRCLTIITDDSTEQTRRVFRTMADLETEIETPVDFQVWHDFQEWIAARETRAIVPFVEALSELMPDSATRLRRDFASLLSFVRAHALLCQAQRETDAHGRILASVEGDYGPVRELVSDLIAEGVEAGVSQTIRETVEAVAELQQHGAEHVSPKTLQESLGVGRSATYDRIRRALLTGYLVNLASRDERGMRLKVGAALPGADDFLPSVEEIVRYMSTEESGRANDLAAPVSNDLSGIPARPVMVPDLPADAPEWEKAYWARRRDEGQVA